MPRFVVQEHHASRLHWDFRLEMDEVLKSWAVPKGPPTEPGIRRLAVAVEDHQLDYIDFEGVIEEGYGKGVVSIWDEGEYELVSREPDLIRVRLAGSKLRGRYKLVLFKSSGSDFNWLLMKGREEGDPPAKKVARRKVAKKVKKKAK